MQLQLVQFQDDYYDEGKIKFSANQCYLLTSETQSLVNFGFAELVDPVTGAEHLEVLKALVDITEQRAKDAQDQADALKAEADKAKQEYDAACGKKVGKKQEKTVVVDDPVVIAQAALDAAKAALGAEQDPSAKATLAEDVEKAEASLAAAQAAAKK